MAEIKIFGKKEITKKQKLLIAIIAAIVLIDVILFSTLISVSNSKKLRLNVVGQEDPGIALTALDSSAKKNLIKENQFADYKFSSKQKELFQQIYEEKGSVALTVRLSVKPTQEQKNMAGAEDSFQVGFLDSSDFKKNGKFFRNIYSQNKRVVVKGSVIKFLTYYPDGTVDISIALPKKSDYSEISYVNQNVPEGFFVFSPVKCQIVDACITPALLGFEATEAIPFYGFSYNGGIIDFSNTSFDFSGGSIAFPTENNSKKIMPQYKITFSDEESLKSTVEETKKIEINMGGEKLYLNNVALAKTVTIPSGALKSPFSRMEIIENKKGISSIVLQLPQKSDSLSPIITDPGLILKYPKSAWRNIDYEFFEWDRFPGILIFDTRNYEVQDRMFTRLAYFVEKAGYKGTLLTNVELDGKHGYNAHDYSAVSMAEFFNKAARENFHLNDEEITLKKILIANGLFESDGNFVKANEGGLVSISQETKPGTRANLLAHEGWHTLFFRDEAFRNYVGAVYYTMDPTSREFLVDYFKSQPQLGYDTEDSYLMNNEFMAYIMQQRVSEVGKYFVHHANRGSVITYTPELAAYVRKTEGRGFEDAAIALNDFVFDQYGIVCGNIALVNRY